MAVGWSRTDRWQWVGVGLTDVSGLEYRLTYGSGLEYGLIEKEVSHWFPFKLGDPGQEPDSVHRWPAVDPLRSADDPGQEPDSVHRWPAVDPLRSADDPGQEPDSVHRWPAVDPLRLDDDPGQVLDCPQMACSGPPEVR